MALTRGRAGARNRRVMHVSTRFVPLLAYRRIFSSRSCCISAYNSSWHHADFYSATFCCCNCVYICTLVRVYDRKACRLCVACHKARQERKQSEKLMKLRELAEFQCYEMRWMDLWGIHEEKPLQTSKESLEIPISFYTLSFINLFFCLISRGIGQS